MSALLRRRPLLGLVPSAAFLAFYVSDLTNRYPVHLPRPGSPLLEPVQAGHRVEGATVLVARVPERVLLAASPTPSPPSSSFFSPEEEPPLPTLTTAYLSTFLSTRLQQLEALLFSLSPWTSSAPSASSLPPYTAGQAALPAAVEALNTAAERWGVGSRVMSGGKLVWEVVRVDEERVRNGEGAVSLPSFPRRQHSPETEKGQGMVELRFGSSIEYPPSRPSAFAPQLPDEKPDTGSLPRLAFELHMLYARLLLDGTVRRLEWLAREAERGEDQL